MTLGRRHPQSRAPMSCFASSKRRSLRRWRHFALIGRPVCDGQGPGPDWIARRDRVAILLFTQRKWAIVVMRYSRRRIVEVLHRETTQSTCIYSLSNHDAINGTEKRGGHNVA